MLREIDNLVRPVAAFGICPADFNDYVATGKTCEPFFGVNDFYDVILYRGNICLIGDVFSVLGKSHFVNNDIFSLHGGYVATNFPLWRILNAPREFFPGNISFKLRMMKLRNHNIVHSFCVFVGLPCGSSCPNGHYNSDDACNSTQNVCPVNHILPLMCCVGRVFGAFQSTCHKGISSFKELV